MKLHKCNVCGLQNTTKTVECLGREDNLLYFNCKCGGTFVISRGFLKFKYINLEQIRLAHEMYDTPENNERGLRFLDALIKLIGMGQSHGPK